MLASNVLDFFRRLAFLRAEQWWCYFVSDNQLTWVTTLSLARIGSYSLWPVRGEHQEFWFGDAAERLAAFAYTFLVVRTVHIL